MGVGGVHHEGIAARLDELGAAVVGILVGAHAGGYAQSAGLVLGGQREGLGLNKVLHCDEANERVVVLHNRQLFHAVLGQQLERLVLGHTLLGHHERHRRHDVLNQAVHVRLEAHVTVGADAKQLALLVHHGQAGDVVLAAHLVHLGDGHVGGGNNRVGNHAGFAALDALHLVHLVLHGEVAVEHADAAVAGHGDGHAGLGDGVHGGRENRDVEFDAAGQARLGVNSGGDDVGFSGEEEDVIEGESGECYLVGIVTTGVNGRRSHVRFLKIQLVVQILTL